MEPLVLRTARLVLDQPTPADIDEIATYCADPVFERFMTTPWPYERRHAEFFVSEYVPGGWERGDEFAWAIRERTGGPIAGSIGLRPDRRDIGYWLGAPFRRRGYMREAVEAVLDHAFDAHGFDEVRWEAVVGNIPSARLARGLGFRYDGTRRATVGRIARPVPEAWHAVLPRDAPRTPQPGWPAEVAGD